MTETFCKQTQKSESSGIWLLKHCISCNSCKKCRWPFIFMAVNIQGMNIMQIGKQGISTRKIRFIWSQFPHLRGSVSRSQTRNPLITVEVIKNCNQDFIGARKYLDVFWGHIKHSSHVILCQCQSLDFLDNFIWNMSFQICPHKTRLLNFRAAMEHQCREILVTCQKRSSL